MIICTKNVELTVDVVMGKNYIGATENSFAIEIIQADGKRQLIRDDEVELINFTPSSIDSDGSFQISMVPEISGIFRINILLDNDTDNKTVKTISTIVFNVVDPVVTAQHRM